MILDSDQENAKIEESELVEGTTVQVKKHANDQHQKVIAQLEAQGTFTKKWQGYFEQGGK